MKKQNYYPKKIPEKKVSKKTYSFPNIKHKLITKKYIKKILNNIVILKRIFKTIEKFKLVENGDKIFVGLSGGKDSCLALYSLSKYVEENELDVQIVPFHISFDLEFSKDVLKIVKQQAKILNLEVKVLHLKSLNIDLMKAAKKSNRPICSVCGILKRYLMNKFARENSATKLATGHNMDDFLIFFFKNLASKNFEFISKFKPKIKGRGKMVTKIRPLFFVSNNEVKKECERLGLPILKTVCPLISKRFLERKMKWESFASKLDELGINFKIQLLNSIIELSQKFLITEEIRECKICGEPTKAEICSFCKIFRGAVV